MTNGQSALRVPVYLDSNVVIDLFDGKEDDLLGKMLRSITSGPYVFPFSAELVAEITYGSSATERKKRLDLVSMLSRCLYFENSIDNLGFKYSNPSVVYETLTESIDTHDYELHLGNVVSYENPKLLQAEYGIDPQILNDVAPALAVAALDEIISKHEPKNMSDGAMEPQSLDKFIELAGAIAANHGAGNIGQLHPATAKLQQDIVSMFTLLDLFGYWSDKKKTYVKASRLADSRHAFAASKYAHLVSTDKRFRFKAEATFLHYGPKTTVESVPEFKARLISEVG